jgi:uncharacterized SAM-binding protein YcdF (DUF218 family)
VRVGAWSGLLTVLAGFWLIVLAGLPLYVFPPADTVRPSDVVMVLGPPLEPRLELAEELREEGLADRMVISVQESHGQTAENLALCRDEGVTCAVADPSTTRGEVLMMTQLADGAEAPSVIVVTQVAHVARTRYLFAKCYPGEVTVVPVGGPNTLSQWTSQYVYQSAAFVKALFQPCP